MGLGGAGFLGGFGDEAEPEAGGPEHWGNRCGLGQRVEPILPALPGQAKDFEVDPNRINGKLL